MPHVCVIMPVFNAAPFLADAVNSILAQSHADLQLLALDDGSTDDSPAILARLAARDPRLRILGQPNAGTVATLNRALDLALLTPASFIALMHADDLAFPTRLQRQLAYLAAHPEVAICGTWITTFGEQNSREWRYPEHPRYTKPSLLFWCCFAHPTIMFRRQVLEGNGGASAGMAGGVGGVNEGGNGGGNGGLIGGLRYDPDMPMPCEDYALWANASQHFPMANVPEVLLHYRQHPAQSGTLHRQKTAALTREIRRRQLVRLPLNPAPDELELHQRLAESDFPPAPAFIPRARAWLERLFSANHSAALYDPQAFPQILAGRWAALCLHAAAHDPHWSWDTFWRSPLAPFVDRTLQKNRPIPPH